MIFFTGKNEVNDLTDSNLLIKADPDYYEPRFAAIAELRKIDDGTLHKGSGFRRVASLVNVPLFHAVRTVLDPDFMKNKSKFYKWLDSGDNWRYCTYDRRNRASRQAQFERDFGNLFKEKDMGVVFKGGTSGDEHDYRPADVSFSNQEDVNTANNSGIGPGVSFGTQCTGNQRGGYSADPPVPAGGSNPVDSGGDPTANGSDAAPPDIYGGGTKD